MDNSVPNQKTNIKCAPLLSESNENIPPKGPLIKTEKGSDGIFGKLSSLDSSQSSFNMSASSFEATPAKKRVPVKKRLSVGKPPLSAAAAKRAALKGPKTPKRSSLSIKKSPKVAASKKLTTLKGRITKAKTAVATRGKAAARKKPAGDSEEEDDIQVVYEWSPAGVIAERQGVSQWQVDEVISLINQECTVPFIARYRREKTGDIAIEKLREVEQAYQQLKEVQVKVSKVIQASAKELTQEDKSALLSATSMQEVKVVTAGLRGSGARTLAARARAAGLGEAAEALLADEAGRLGRGWLAGLQGGDGRATEAEVEAGLKHVLADVISKDAKMVAYMRAGLRQDRVTLEACQSRKAKAQQPGKDPNKPPKKAPKAASKAQDAKKLNQSDIDKFRDYFQYAAPAWTVYPHIILALNRGEQLDVLSVKAVLPGRCREAFVQYCVGRWLPGCQPREKQTSLRNQLVLELLDDCYERLVAPALCSWVRSELNDKAELASIQVFSANLRRLLLTPGVRTDTLVAIDPGFANGCKLAAVERKGRVLQVATIFPFNKHREQEAVTALVALVQEYRCGVVAIGNGTACRETEAWLGGLIARQAFGDIQVQYTVVNEAGASQYSVTPEARAEFGDMDVNHVSAVSLARRLQDPLLEYVKVPPMHLGIGMYQHDVNAKLLASSLDSVVMECVSFVGVDLNVASEMVLKKVSGLNKSRSAAIVAHREKHGAFRSREELKKVKGIGPVSFQQCAGFVKIVPQTLRRRSLNSNLSALCPLDATTVHPESYDAAKKLIKVAKLELADVGSKAFVEGFQKFIHDTDVKVAAEMTGVSEVTLKTIADSLLQTLDSDYRAQFDKPLFRQGITSITAIKVGEVLTGTVSNVTSFGAFVDCGVEVSGLVHVSKMGGRRLELGNVVKTRVERVDVGRRRIGLVLVDVTRSA